VEVSLDIRAVGAVLLPIGRRGIRGGLFLLGPPRPNPHGVAYENL